MTKQEYEDAYIDALVLIFRGRRIYPGAEKCLSQEKNQEPIEIVLTNEKGNE